MNYKIVTVMGYISAALIWITTTAILMLAGISLFTAIGLSLLIYVSAVMICWIVLLAFNS